MVARLSSASAEGTPARARGSDASTLVPPSRTEEPAAQVRAASLRPPSPAPAPAGARLCARAPWLRERLLARLAPPAADAPTTCAQDYASPYAASYASSDALPREVEGLDISTYANLKHAFEIIVHSYKLQKEALEANRRRWGEERQDLLSREQNLVEALTAVREALDAGMRVLGHFLPSARASMALSRPRQRAAARAVTVLGAAQRQRRTTRISKRSKRS